MANMYFSNQIERLEDGQRWLYALLFLTIGLLLIGCTEQASDATEKKNRVVSMVLTDLQGREQSLADYRGKWVIVNYWATWCPPCLEEIPELVQFHNEHKDRDAVVWGINREEISRADLDLFVAKQQISYPLFQVPADSASVLGPVLSIPTTYLVSPKGKVVARHVGFVTVKKLEEFIQGYTDK